MRECVTHHSACDCREALPGEAPCTGGGRVKRQQRRKIGAMLALMLGKSPNGQAYSVLDNQSAIIAALLGHHEGKPGISARTLEEKFAAAKRSLSAT